MNLIGDKMKKLDLEFGTRIINNGPLVIVGTSDKKWDDFAPVAWTMPTSKKPPTLTLCIGPSHKTWDNIYNKKVFTCNIPGKNLLKEIAFFGGVSAKDFDKIKIANTEVSRAREIDVPYLNDSLAYLECKIISMDKDTHLVKGEIISAYAKEEAFTDHWKLNKGFYPLHHLGGEFYECGGEILIQERLKKW
jgi:flavin reductase (DIM6/NTAB) family NADH-FMN oxidoreductase RutF